MSDDDPKNVELITEEMKCLKELYPDMSFFVIQTYKDYFVKTEVYQQAWPNQKIKKDGQDSQLKLF